MSAIESPKLAYLRLKSPALVFNIRNYVCERLLVARPQGFGFGTNAAGQGGLRRKSRFLRICAIFAFSELSAAAC
jgi:hypothetical protein